MSTTTDTGAARLIAEALITQARREPDHGRFHLGELFGVTPEEVFDELTARLTPAAAVQVITEAGPTDLQGIDLGEAGHVLVPYLVAPGGTANRGSAGFAAVLRDEVPAGEGKKVLVILDDNPVETVRTTSKEARLLSALSWKSLVHEALDGATNPVMRAVRDDSERLEHRKETLANLARLATYAPEEAGAHLHELGVYLRDTHAHSSPGPRLKRSARWRDRLDTWSAPGKDVEVLLRAEYSDPYDSAANKVIGAKGVFGFDYDLFDLDDLPQTSERKATKLALANPPRVRGSAYLSTDRNVVAWVPDGREVSLVLKGRHRASTDTATATWSSGERTEAEFVADNHELVVRLPQTSENSGWLFADITVNGVSNTSLAVYTKDGGDWFPVEAALDIDTHNGAFRAGESPQVLCIDARSRFKGTAVLEPEGPNETLDEAVLRSCRLGMQAAQVWLLTTAETSDTDDPDKEGPDGDPGPDGPDGDPGPDGPDGEPPLGPDVNPDDPETEDPDPTSPTPWSGDTTPSCVPFALIAAARAGRPVTEAYFSVTEGRGVLTGGVRIWLEDQSVAMNPDRSVNGLDLEAHILRHPDTLNFELLAAPNLLAKDQRLEKLTFDDLDQQALRTFFSARKNLFAALADRGSVHAIGAGHAVDDARAYVEAYQQLLETIDYQDRYRAEYERLLLSDSITDNETGHVYLAPTNPVTVAFLLATTDAVTSWLPRANLVLPADLDGISPRHLLPTFARNTTWFETAPGTPLLWRKFRPRGSENAGNDGQGQYIAKRLTHFLKVHPHYLHRRQTIALTFHEPGMGEPVVEALITLFGQLERHFPLDNIPNVAVTLIHSTRRLGVLERFISGDLPTPPRLGKPAKDLLSEKVRRLMRDKVRVTTQSPDAKLPFAHLSFVFRSPLERSQATFDLASRSGTLWADGLAATPGRLVVPTANETTFGWGTFTGEPADTPLHQVVRYTLNLVSGMPHDNLTPGKTRMQSTRIQSAYLRNVYDASIWVVHLDRLLGLEAFAPRTKGQAPEKYLIDYEDRADPSQPGLDAITATEKVDPYRRALRRSMQHLGEPSDAALDRVLSLFNRVSGTWALALLDPGSNTLKERIGFAACIAAVSELDGGFTADARQVSAMVPVRELIDALPQGVARPAGSHSDDLLHLHVDLVSRPVRVSCRVLEVKYRTGSDHGAPHTARKQLDTTTAWLRRIFDTDGPGRLFRSRDLAELIRGAITRAEAFDALSVAAAREPFESALNAITRGEFAMTTRYTVNGQVLEGDFVSIEAGNGFAAHRQPLAGPGEVAGHIRLGEPILRALAAGTNLPRATGWARPLFDFPADATAKPGRASGGETGPNGTVAPTDATAHPAPDHSTDPTSLTGSSDLTGATGEAGSLTAPSDVQPEQANVGLTIEPPPPTTAKSPEGQPTQDETPVDSTPATNQRPVGEPHQDEANPPSGTPAWGLGAEHEIAGHATRLDAAFERYGLAVEPFDTSLVQVGPSLLRFRTKAMGRLSIKDVERRERDISREIGAPAPVSVGDAPGYITVDVPRTQRQAVLLDSLLPDLDRHPGKPGALNFVAGVAPGGEIRIADLSRLPHLLVAGATGSGKSVFLRGMLLELLRARTPEQLSLLIIDPKRLDFAPFANAEHLRGGRILHQPDEALQTLSDTLAMDLEWRQPILAEAGVSSAAEYYEMGGRLEDLPQLVIVVDEFADLILGGNDRVAFSEMIQRFAQLTRAYGIFLVLATQRPSVDVITGSIKANLSARIAFSLPSGRDSMTVLDRPGAEDLLGDGDLLFYNNGRVERLQAPFVRPSDVRDVLNQ